MNFLVVRIFTLFRYRKSSQLHTSKHMSEYTSLLKKYAKIKEEDYQNDQNISLCRTFISEITSIANKSPTEVKNDILLYHRQALRVLFKSNNFSRDVIKLQVHFARCLMDAHMDDAVVTVILNMFGLLSERPHDDRLSRSPSGVARVVFQPFKDCGDDEIQFITNGQILYLRWCHQTSSPLLHFDPSWLNQLATDDPKRSVAAKYLLSFPDAAIRVKGLLLLPEIKEADIAKVMARIQTMPSEAALLDLYAVYHQRNLNSLKMIKSACSIAKSLKNKAIYAQWRKLMDSETLKPSSTVNKEHITKAVEADKGKLSTTQLIKAIAHCDEKTVQTSFLLDLLQQTLDQNLGQNTKVKQLFARISKLPLIPQLLPVYAKFGEIFLLAGSEKYVRNVSHALYNQGVNIRSGNHDDPSALVYLRHAWEFDISSGSENADDSFKTKVICFIQALSDIHDCHAEARHVALASIKKYPEIIEDISKQLVLLFDEANIFDGLDSATQKTCLETVIDHSSRRMNCLPKAKNALGYLRNLDETSFLWRSIFHTWSSGDILEWLHEHHTTPLPILSATLDCFRCLLTFNQDSITQTVDSVQNLVNLLHSDSSFTAQSKQYRELVIDILSECCLRIGFHEQFIESIGASDPKSAIHLLYSGRHDELLNLATADQILEVQSYISRGDLTSAGDVIANVDAPEIVKNHNLVVVIESMKNKLSYSYTLALLNYHSTDLSVAGANILQLIKTITGIIKTFGQFHFSSILSSCELLAARIFERMGAAHRSLIHIERGLSMTKASTNILQRIELLSLQLEISVRMQLSDRASSLAQDCLHLISLFPFLADSKHSTFLSYAKAMTLYLQRTGQYDDEKNLYNIAGTTSAIDITSKMKRMSIAKSIGDQNMSFHTTRDLKMNLIDGLVDRGNVEEAEDYLSDLLENETDAKIFEVTIANFNFVKARIELRADPVYGVLEDSALSSPSIIVNDIVRQTSVPSRALLTLESASRHVQNVQNVDSFENFSSTKLTTGTNLDSEVFLHLSALSYESPKMMEFEKWRGTSIQMETCALKSLPTTLESIQHDDVLSKIPDSWLIVSMNCSPITGNLQVSRYEKSRQPLTISLALSRHSCRDTDAETFTFQDGLSKLQSIIKQNDLSASKEVFEQVKSAKDRRNWWEKRFQLDQELGQLVEDIEYSWFGGFRGLFSDVKLDEVLLHTFIKSVETILNTYLPSRNKGKAPFALDPRVMELFLHMGNPNSLEDPGFLEDLVYFIIDILQFHGEMNAYDEVDLDRMVVSIEEAMKAYYNQCSSSTAERYEHIVLIVDKECQQFPWEVIPMLCGKSVSRVPNLRYLGEILKSQNEGLKIPSENAYLVLNPEGDLPSTENKFGSRLFSWKGIKGRVPAENEIADALTESDLYIYMGHGAGDRYIRSAKVQSLPRCAPSLLLGCSSGTCHLAGEYDSRGTVSSYMAAGCPMIVANLWVVTDKDIDAFAESILNNWGKEGMGRAVRDARMHCKLRYLNGASPVLYGLPLAAQSS